MKLSLGRVIFSFGVILAVAPSLLFGDKAPDLHEIQKNRERTKAAWAEQSILFPCEDLLVKHKGNLPRLTIDGEFHNHPYCEGRRNAIFRNSVGPDAIWCSGFEAYPAPKDKSPDTREIKGIENEDTKRIMELLAAYYVIQSKTPKESYDFSFVPQVFDGALGRRKLKSLSLSKDQNKKEFADSMMLYLDLIHKAITDKNDPLKQMRLAQLIDVADKNRSIVAEVLPELAREKVAELLKIRTEDLRENVVIPFGLKDEVEHSLHMIDASVNRPDDKKCLADRKACFDYQWAWREQIMGFNAALIYCDNLAKKVPLSEVHIVSGREHISNVVTVLRKDAESKGIPLSYIDGGNLADMVDAFLGVTNKDLTYPDQAIQEINIEGKKVGYSLQRDGVRIVVHEENFDPLVGAPLAQSTKGEPEVRVYGPPEQVTQLFTSLVGKPAADQQARIKQTKDAQAKLLTEMKALLKK